MSVNIQFKRGASSNLPSSAPSGEPLWCEDTKELYIGTGISVQKVGSTSEIATGAVQDGDGNIITETYERILKPVNILQSSGYVYLEDNSINKISASSTVVFILPEIVDTSEFHQILIQLYMPSPYTINLGTSYFFYETNPDMSTPGYYDIIYEYDSVRWNVGVIKKGVAT